MAEKEKNRAYLRMLLNNQEEETTSFSISDYLPEKRSDSTTQGLENFKSKVCAIFKRSSSKVIPEEDEDENDPAFTEKELYSEDFTLTDSYFENEKSKNVLERYIDGVVKI